MSLEDPPSVIDFLRERIRCRLGTLEDGIDDEKDLAELGLKSIDVVLISGELEDQFQIEVDPIMMFEHHTIHAVASHVVRLIEDQSDQQVALEARPQLEAK